LPFALKGIDSDNGSEFINHELLRYAEQERITFTRGRAWRKNDGCFVEQKNYSVVRRALGYARYEGSAQLRLLNELYAELRLYTNFFQPVMKLLRKERRGAKVKKTYDRPRTPCQRLLDSPALSTHAKQRLRAQYAVLNPAELKRNISRLQTRLLKLARRAPAHLSPEVDSMRCHGGTTPTKLSHSHESAATRRLGPTPATLHGRGEHLAQCLGGDDAAGIPQRAKLRASLQSSPSAVQTLAQAIARQVKAGPVRGRTMR
jgi:hypothetical protein